MNGDNQRQVALEKLEKIMAEKDRKQIFTNVENVGPFYRAEEYHQDFLNKQTGSLM